MKPVYLLAGGRGGDRKKMTAIIRTVLKETGKPSPKIAYIGAATDDNLLFYKMMTLPITAAGAGEVKRVVLASKKADILKAKTILEAADVIYFGGGDVERGMQVLEEKNMVGFIQELARQDKIIFGISAGSIMLAKEWVRWKNPDDDDSVEIFPCLNIAPVVCDTHAEEDGWEELKTLLKIAPADMTGYGIPSDAAIKVSPDGTVEALGTAVVRFSRRGKQVSRGPDILPG